jgi:hypothetical protein
VSPDVLDARSRRTPAVAAGGGRARNAPFRRVIDAIDQHVHRHLPY